MPNKTAAPKKFQHVDIFTITKHKNSGYDIPLHTRLGTEFLVLLIALMTYLSLLAASGTVALGHLADKWVSGLADTMTIEIPAQEGSLTHAEALQKALQGQKGIKSAKILNQEDMGEILSPWLGDKTAILADLPLPTLLSIEMDKRTDTLVATIKNKTNTIAPEAIIDAHEDWLGDLLKLTNGLRFTGLVIFGLILAVTALVIAGAVRSRMAIHQRELELLHIMGASDKYISMQFIRYIFSQSNRGMAIGLLCGSLTLLAFLYLAKQSQGTIPEISLVGNEWLILLIVPVLLLGIGVITARQTVLRVLNEMP